MEDISDHCLFCLDKIVPYNLEETKSDKKDDSSFSFRNLCKFLNIKITNEQLKQLKVVPIFVSDDSTESRDEFLCLSCFEMSVNLSKLYCELELIKKKIDDQTETIRDVIRRETNGSLISCSRKRGRKKKNFTSLEFVKLFQKTVRNGAGESCSYKHQEISPSLEAGVTVKTEASQEDDELDHFSEDFPGEDQEFLNGNDDNDNEHLNLTDTETKHAPLVETESLTATSTKIDDCIEAEPHDKTVPAKMTRQQQPKSGVRKRKRKQTGSKVKDEEEPKEKKRKPITSHITSTLKSLDIKSIHKPGNDKIIVGRICPVCDRKVKGVTLSIIMEHMLSHEVTSSSEDNHPQNFCNDCGKRFSLKINLDLHKLCHHDKPPTLKCDICQKHGHKTREDLTAHLKSHDNDVSIHSCKSCPMVCSTLDKLLSHMTKHSNSKKLICPECDWYESTTLKELYQHCHEIHPEQKQKFDCHLCTKSFIIPTTLHYHLRQIHGIGEKEGSNFKELKCPKCPSNNGKIYKTKQTLYNHDLICHSDNNRRIFKCDQCEMPFVCKSFLQIHIEKKHDKIRHPCPHCSKSFLDKAQFTYHLRTHSGEDMFTCDVCGKQFPSLKQLTRHGVVHLEKTENICEICGKKFGNQSYLQRHIQINHKREKNLECEHCGMKFKRRDHLTSHLRTHTGERPFECPVCGKGFNRKDIMIIHMKVHGYSQEEAGIFYKSHLESLKQENV